jgi:hypothetical protein
VDIELAMVDKSPIIIPPQEKLVQIGERMKVATVSVAGERRVGQITRDGAAITPFDLSVSEAQVGILAVIRSNGLSLPPTLSPIPLAQVLLEAPIPKPPRNIFCVGKNHHEHAHEFARSGFDASGAKDVVPADPIIFSKVPESVVPNGSAVVIDPKVSPAVDYEAELAVIIGKGGRGIAAKDAFDHVNGARSASALWPMADRQIAGHVLSDGPGCGYPRRHRHRRHPNQMLRQWRAAAELEYRFADIRYSRDHRGFVGRDYLAAGRRNRHRNPQPVSVSVSIRRNI